MGFVFAQLCVTFLFLSMPFLAGLAKSSRVVLCIESERQALLSFKRGIVGYETNPALASWAAEDEECCGWAGVTCDNSTGHVEELRLASRSLRGKVSPSLLNLTRLSYLSLRLFDSEGTPIPEFIGSLAGLRHLDLKSANFGGMIPPQLGNLLSLRNLSLGCFSCELYSEKLEWLSGLSSLEYLDMFQVNLNKASDHWLLAINKLPSLLELHLSSCQLGHIHSLSHVNFTSLEILDISNNNFNSFLPDWIFRLGNLVDLDMSSSKFVGPFPNCSWSLNSLRRLDASYNELNSSIPSCLYSITTLEDLDLAQNYLQGGVSSSLGNLTSLVRLSLSDNSLAGELPMSVGNLHKLQTLLLMRNRFSGPLPKSLGKLSALNRLDISSNKFNSSLPETIGSLSNLTYLDISQNNLEGVVSEPHFSNLTSLTQLRASKNSLVLRVSPDWIPPFNINGLVIGSWKLGPKFPEWLKSQKQISGIDLSNTGISGPIPSWFWNLSSTFRYIDFCNNQLSGELSGTLQINSISIIYLCSNKFSGTIPPSYFEAWELDLSNNSLSGDISDVLCSSDGPSSLYFLNLGNNLLSGKIPDCLMKKPALQVIEFSSNNLSGEIPSSFGSLQILMSLNLRNNSLSGEIPSSLRNCTSLRSLNLGLNKLEGSIPTWVGVSLSNLTLLGLRSNKFNGQIPRELCRLTKLQIFDASDNHLSGNIPSCFNNFSAMTTRNLSDYPFYVSSWSNIFFEKASVTTKGREAEYKTNLPLVTNLDLSRNNLSGKIPDQLTSLQGLRSLNLSSNNLRGSIPDKIGDMRWIESLDVSRNKLSGEIPPSMSNLNFLSYLNVSYNNLSGKIPPSTQLQSLNPSSFISNRLLCGPPLSNDCKEGEEKVAETKDDRRQEEGDEDEAEYWFRLGIGVGFAVGFLGFISPLMFFGFWRRAYFWFFQEYVWYKILECFIKFKYMMGISKPTHLA